MCNDNNIPLESIGYKESPQLSMLNAKIDIHTEINGAIAGSIQGNYKKVREHLTNAIYLIDNYLE
jgi:hypothetical protein